MNNIENTPYNKVSFKASHNSYSSDIKPITLQLQWNIEKPYEMGCSGLELDIHQKGDGKWEWKVSHAASIWAKSLDYYLKELLQWSNANPGHRVISIFVDLKNDPNSAENKKLFPKEFDSYIAQYFDADRIFGPKDLIKNEENLLISVSKYGWPSIDQLKGKFIFCFTSDNDLKEIYTNTEIKKRIFFCAARYLTDSNVNKVFYNLHVTDDPDSEYYIEDPALKALFKNPYYSVRVYLLDEKNMWEKALEYGANVLATDKISGCEWAAVGEFPYKII